MERNLLLVDDEPNIIRSLVRLLRRDGYNIITANSGREGLELLSSHDVGVIISDQRMPEMNGTEFLSQVKEKYPNNVRIVLSGFTDLKSVTDAINEGAIYKFLTKPWDDDLLRKNVEEAFKIHEMEAENKRLQGELQKLNIDLQNANDELAISNKELESHIVEKVRQVSVQNKTINFAHEMLDNLPFVVIGIDASGMIVMANRKAEEIIVSLSGLLLGEMAENAFNEEFMGIIRRWDAQDGNEPHSGRCVVNQEMYDLFLTYIRNGSQILGRLVTLVAEKDLPCIKKLM